jgi:hypothetical protein
MRIRQVKPEFWASLDIARLPRLTRLHFIALWNYADDDGRAIDDHRLIKASCFPLDDDVNAAEIEHHQDVLAREGRILRYEVDGRRYFEVLRFRDHQYVQKRKDSVHPPVSDGTVTEPLPDSDGTGTACVGVSVGEGVGVSVAPTKSTRVADELFEALVDACAIDAASLTQTGRGPLNKALAELRGAHATPDEVRQRAHNYRLVFADAALTPMALAKHWAQCARPPVANGAGKGQAVLDRLRSRDMVIDTNGRQS